MKQPVAAGNGIYREMLLAKRHDVLAGLGFKFDTLARMGRVAEEDQAQISHDEFVSLRVRSLDYTPLRLVGGGAARGHNATPRPASPLSICRRTRWPRHRSWAPSAGRGRTIRPKNQPEPEH